MSLLYILTTVYIIDIRHELPSCSYIRNVHHMFIYRYMVDLNTITYIMIQKIYLYQILGLPVKHIYNVIVLQLCGKVDLHMFDRYSTTKHSLKASVSNGANGFLCLHSVSSVDFPRGSTNSLP